MDPFDLYQAIQDHSRNLKAHQERIEGLTQGLVTAINTVHSDLHPDMLQPLLDRYQGDLERALVDHAGQQGKSLANHLHNALGPTVQALNQQHRQLDTALSKLAEFEKGVLELQEQGIDLTHTHAEWQRLAGSMADEMGGVIRDGRQALRQDLDEARAAAQTLVHDSSKALALHLGGVVLFGIGFLLLIGAGTAFYLTPSSAYQGDIRLVLSWVLTASGLIGALLGLGLYFGSTE